MPLRRRAVEPAESGRRVPRDPVPVEQQLAVERLRLRLTAFGERAKGRRALPGIIREARGAGGGGDCRRQNLNSTVPKTVRPGAIDA